MFIKKTSNSRAFTIVELLMASVITIIVGAAIAVLFITSMRMFGRGMAQTDIQRRTRVAMDRLSRDIRNSSPTGITVFTNYAGAVPNTVQGDYIEITSATAPIVTKAYYLSASGGINFIKNVVFDNPALETDDKEIISGVSKTGASIFTGTVLPLAPITDSVRIQFKVTSSKASTGSQNADFITDVYMRNP